MRTSRRLPMNYGIGLLLLASTAFSPRAEAKAIPELVAQLRQGMSWIQGSMDTDTARQKEDSWYFRRFWLRLRPKATLVVPGVKITLVPEVELLLERDLPDGWGTY